MVGESQLNDLGDLSPPAAGLRSPFSVQELDMRSKIAELLAEEQGQDIAEYAVMLAVILVIVVGTIRIVGSNANSVFSQAASSIQ
jgi:Flp pilus assembly pilin Flp